MRVGADVIRGLRVLLVGPGVLRAVALVPAVVAVDVAVLALRVRFSLLAAAQREDARAATRLGALATPQRSLVPPRPPVEMAARATLAGPRRPPRAVRVAPARLGDRGTGPLADGVRRVQPAPLATRREEVARIHIPLESGETGGAPVPPRDTVPAGALADGRDEGVSLAALPPPLGRRRLADGLSPLRLRAEANVPGATGVWRCPTAALGAPRVEGPVAPLVAGPLPPTVPAAPPHGATAVVALLAVAAVGAVSSALARCLAGDLAPATPPLVVVPLSEAAGVAAAPATRPRPRFPLTGAGWLPVLRRAPQRGRRAGPPPPLPAALVATGPRVPTSAA